MKWKSLAVYVLCCFLLCNSVLADFESAFTGSDGGSESALGSVSVSSDSGSDSALSDVAPSDPVEAAPSDPVDMSPFESVDLEFTPDETQVPLEKVDENVSSVPDLVTPSVPELSGAGDNSEVSPGGNTFYVLTKPFVEGETNVGAAPSDPVLTDVSMLTGLSPVTPGDTSGLKAVLLSFIGNYDPPVVQFEYTSSNNYKQYVHEIQPDYVWICSFALIALFVYCLFKLGGALIRG